MTGRPYADVVRTTLWEPLHLRASGTFRGDLAPPGRGAHADAHAAARGYSQVAPPMYAHGYAASGGSGQPPRRREGPMPDFIIAAGGVYSTAPDVLALLNGVYGDAVLTPASQEALSRVYVPAEDYAYGSRTRTRTFGGRPRAVAWHTGSNGGYRALAARVLADGWTVIMLNNTSADLAGMGGLADEVLRVIHP